MERSRVCKGAKSSLPYCISLILYTKTHIHKHTIHPYLLDQLCLTLQMRLEWWVLKWIPPILVFRHDRPCECDCEHIPPVFHSLVVRDAKYVLTYYFTPSVRYVLNVLCVMSNRQKKSEVYGPRGKSWMLNVNTAIRSVHLV